MSTQLSSARGWHLRPGRTRSLLPRLRTRWRAAAWLGWGVGWASCWGMAGALGAALVGEARDLKGNLYRGEIRAEEGAFSVVVNPSGPVRLVPEQLGYLRCERVPGEVLSAVGGGAGGLTAEGVLAKPVPQKTKLPPGVLLTTGTFLARPPHAADETSLRFSGNEREPALSTVNVAALFFQTTAVTAVERHEPGRPGLLLESGDFIDGEFKQYQHGRVQISSVLFGLRTFERYRVRAAFLREAQPRPVAFEVRSRDGSLFRVESLVVSPEGVALTGPQLAGFKLALADLVEITRPRASPVGTARGRLSSDTDGF